MSYSFDFVGAQALSPDGFSGRAAMEQRFRQHEERTAEKPRSAPKPQDVTKPVNVIKLARARLAEVKREIKRLRKLEAEQKELERLLDAARGKRLATVRELKRASG